MLNLFRPRCQQPTSDTRLILAALAELRTTMSKTTDALARLSAVDVTLAAEINTLLSTLAGEPQAIADAVTAALANVGADDATTAAAVDAATTASQALVDKITAAITPTPAPVAGADTTSGATGADTSIG